MTENDRELFEELLEDEEFASGLTRSDLLKRGAAASAAIWGVSSLFGAQTAFGSTQARVLTPTFYPWIYGLYPPITKGLNKHYGKRHKLRAKIAPRTGVGTRRSTPYA